MVAMSNQVLIPSPIHGFKATKFSTDGTTDLIEVAGTR